MSGSTNRARKGGFVDFKKAARGPEGRLLCRWCAKEVPKGRRTFCSGPCVHEWRVRTDPGYARAEVEKRDYGICGICGIDTVRVERVLRLLRTAALGTEAGGWMATSSRGQVAWPVVSQHAMERARRVFGTLRARGFDVWIYGSHHGSGSTYSKIGWRHLWEADHIRAIIEGGGECGLDNLRTACLPCHKQATRELAGRRKALRGNAGGQTLLDVMNEQSED